MNKQWQTTTEEVDEMKHFSFCRFLFTLHRPSPRVPFPSVSSLLTCFDAATKWAQIANEHFERGYFRRPWFATRYNFEAAMIVLFSLRHAGAAIRQKFDLSNCLNERNCSRLTFLLLPHRAGKSGSLCGNLRKTFPHLTGVCILSRPCTSLPSCSRRRT